MADLQWSVSCAILLSVTTSAAVSRAESREIPAESVPGYSDGDAVLHRHINADGWVDYAGTCADARFDNFLESITNTDPSGLTPDDYKLALWINVCEAVVIEQVLELLPADESKWVSFRVIDAERLPSFTGGKWFSNGLRFTIAGRPYTLDEIEKGVLLGQSEYRGDN